MPGGLSEQAKKSLTFWGMVGAVMTALKLKDRWDDYRAVPSEEDGLGPVALRTPAEEEGLEAAMHEVLDTEIPSSRPQRKKADCCVCCGLRCGLFWKAFGIVCLIFIVWQGIKLAFWLMTPSPTGLEGMPEFNTSLGCQNAPFVYNSGMTTFTVPVSPTTLDHAMDFRGKAVGTITIAQGAVDATEVKYEMMLRTDDESLFNNVVVDYPSTDHIDAGAQSRFLLSTSTWVSTACMRYDVTIYIPPNMKEIDLLTHTVAQVKFDTDSNFDFGKLWVTMFTMGDNNLLLPHTGVHASDLRLEMFAGWMVGDVAIVDKTALVTQQGSAVMNVHVHPVPSSSEPPATASLQTTTGSGRSDLFYENHSGHPHRPISSVHRSSRNGDLYLTYKNADFNGVIDLSAQSWSARGMQGSVNKVTGELPWVGNKEGGDSIVASSQRGWIGLYF
ncbi:hypothetical protein CERSUDRAFT_114287 [Gelatoporia subvermispora B]|uniref:Uncharacterized protein n=1 Tax=Ceriporiopsis subvermispora (strain B) TaxID=914234 RepID=M2RGN9_CERS8|nr:hypothetical protein CERSUDRAFT_114287 [Gelatoporia subvermispora B]